MTLRVKLAGVGMRTEWREVLDLVAASRACRECIEEHDFGASQWRGGAVVDDATKKGIATVSYNGRIWLADGTEAGLDGNA